MPTAKVGRFRPGLLLLQHRNDCSSVNHCFFISPSSIGRTLIYYGGDPQWQASFIHDSKHGTSAIPNHPVPLLSMKEFISRSQSETWAARSAHVQMAAINSPLVPPGQPRPMLVYVQPSSRSLCGANRFRPSKRVFDLSRRAISLKSGARNCCHSVQIASASA